MVTLADTITNVRTALDESSTTVNKFYSNPEIRVWINDAVRDLARRTETILVLNVSLTANVGQAKYNLPQDVIRVHRCEFIPENSTQVYPVQASTYDEMDMVWGINPTQQSSYPWAYACWGTPGSMTMQFFPVPAQTGTFNLYYYGMPTNLATDGTDDTLDLQIPAGWDDCIVLCCEYRAKRKGKDPTWQEAKVLYEETIQHLVNVTRQAHDNGRFIQTSTSNVPQWLYAFGDV